MVTGPRRLRLGGLRRFLWPAAVLGVVALGVWGHWRTDPTQPWPERLYATARLFFLNLDITGTHDPDPWLWVAAVLAPLLVLRGLAAVFRDHLQGVVVQLLARPEVVVIGAGHRAVALVNAHGRRNEVVVVDPDPRRLAAIRELGAWTVVGDGTSARSLRRAAVGRASDIVVMTGDDSRNCLITAAVRRYRSRTAEQAPAQIYVELTDPGLARTLERGGRSDGAATTAFSGVGLAAADVLDALDRPAGRLLDPADGPPALALFGRGPLIDAIVLELHQRRRVQLLRAGGAATAAPRIALFGPDAVRRHDALQTLLGTDLAVLGLAAFPVELAQVTELGAATARQLLDFLPLRAALVLAEDDLSAGAIAQTLAQHLGAGCRVTLVTESPETPFGAQTAQDPTPSTLRTFRVPALAYPLARLRQHRVEDRLARGLYEGERGSGPVWAELDPDAQGPHRTAARDVLNGPAGRYLSVDTFRPVEPPELPVVRALGVTRPAALPRAGIAIDLRTPPALVEAGKALLARGDRAAFDTWCEAARLDTDPGVIADWMTGLSAKEGEDLADVTRLLLLRRAALGEEDANAELAGTRRPWVEGELVVIVGGGIADAPTELAQLFACALTGPVYPGFVVEPVRLGGVTRRLHAVTRPKGVSTRPPGSPTDSPRRQHLDLWSAILGSGRSPDTIRVLALPGDDEVHTQLGIARALGATIGWLPLAGPGDPEPDPARTLLGGAQGLVGLPIDRMTVRAFVRPSHWTRPDVPRDRVAERLHAAYVARQRDQKDPGDPALRPFAELSPALQRSNRAVVDDIPAKLGAVSLRLCALEDAPKPRDWPVQPDLGLLAEMEHGRWNVERLLSGWASGSRDPGRLLSPHLRPWDELSAATRRWDLDIVTDLPRLLAEVGLGIAVR